MTCKPELNHKVRVLDKGWIELQAIMGCDQDIVNAARTSYLGDSKGPEADKKLLFYLMEHRHTTPFEMVEFRFRVHAPLVTIWQWVRHRTWSYNMSSGRYTELEEFYMPEEWRLQAADNKQASDGKLDMATNSLLTAAMWSVMDLGTTYYRAAIQKGVAREQARLFLPGFAMYYTFVAKVDAHNLMHFLKLRMGEHAQYEIRVYAQAIYEHFFKPMLPWTAEAFEKFVLKEED